MRKSYLIVLLIVAVGLLLVVSLLHFTEDRTKALVHIAIDASVVVVAAFVAHFISERVARIGERKEMMEMIEEAMTRPSNRHMLQLLYGGNEVLASSGVIRVPKTVNSIEMPPLPRRGGTLIQLMFIGLSPERFGEANKQAMRERLRAKEGKMQILLLDPESGLVDQRQETLGLHDYRELMRADFHRLERYFHDLSKEVPDLWERLEIRLYHVFPSCVYIRVDDHQWFAPLWNHDSAVGGPLVEVCGGEEGGLRDTLEANFNHVWNMPTTTKYEPKH